MKTFLIVATISLFSLFPFLLFQPPVAIEKDTNEIKKLRIAILKTRDSIETNISEAKSAIANYKINSGLIYQR